MQRNNLVGRLCAVSLFAGGLMMGCGPDVDTTPNTPSAGKFNTPAKINAFLEGKTLVMTGEDIPSHPNGFSEKLNLGANTQCYSAVTMKIAGGKITVLSDMGTLKNAPMQGDTGDCDHSTKSGEVSFVSQSVLVDNVKGEGQCFDFTVNYEKFGQEGRGQLNADGTELKLELYFRDQAAGHRCGDGDVGDKPVTVVSKEFTGNAVQTYTITATK